MDLNRLTIIEAKKGLKNKDFSVSELLQSCFKKISMLDGKIKAYLTVSEKESLKSAENLEKSDFGNLPLGGIPIAVKDNFLTIGTKTTASSSVLEDYLPVYNATVVDRLEKAGAIILGKTNMDAWAHGSSTETSQFFTTRNPWNTDFLPGGSSGGSAAAVAADMTIGAIGSETAGSIRQPAGWCGVVGFKPTYGAVSRYGVIAMASSTDSPGPMAKTASDAKIIFDVIKGKDSNDATSIDFTQTKLKDFSQLKIGIPKEYFSDDIDKEVKQKVQDAIKVFEKIGAKCFEVSLIDPRYSISVYTIIQRSEVSSNLARYDGIRYGRNRLLFGEEAKRRIMLGTYSLSAGYYDAYYLKAEKIRTLIINDFEKVFQKVDFLIAPTSPSVALPVGSTKNNPMFGEIADVLVEASSLAGIPGINLNCGFSQNNLPIGMQLIGPKFSDYQLLELGEIYQNNTEWHLKKINQ